MDRLWERETTVILLFGNWPSLANHLGIVLGERAGLDGTSSALLCHSTTSGEQFDIHGGGHDLRFPHLRGRDFQSECCTGDRTGGRLLDAQWLCKYRRREDEQESGKLLDHP